MQDGFLYLFFDEHVMYFFHKDDSGKAVDPLLKPVEIAAVLKGFAMTIFIT